MTHAGPRSTLHEPPPPGDGAEGDHVDVDALPGHFIRRLHQIAVAIFLRETAASGLTPVQYGALQSIVNRPDIDQRSLSGALGLDTSTLGGVVDRLEARGLLERHASRDDRRVRRLRLTPAGRELLDEVRPAMLRAQRMILDPLSEAERREFMRMLTILVEANNELSRAPSRTT